MKKAIGTLLWLPGRIVHGLTHLESLGSRAETVVEVRSRLYRGFRLPGPAASRRDGMLTQAQMDAMLASRREPCPQAGFPDRERR